MSSVCSFQIVLCGQISCLILRESDRTFSLLVLGRVWVLMAATIISLFLKLGLRISPKCFYPFRSFILKYFRKFGFFFTCLGSTDDLSNRLKFTFWDSSFPFPVDPGSLGLIGGTGTVGPTGLKI